MSNRERWTHSPVLELSPDEATSKVQRVVEGLEGNVGAELSPHLPRVKQTEEFRYRARRERLFVNYHLGPDFPDPTYIPMVVCMPSSSSSVFERPTAEVDFVDSLYLNGQYLSKSALVRFDGHTFVLGPIRGVRDSPELLLLERGGRNWGRKEGLEYVLFLASTSEGEQIVTCEVLPFGWKGAFDERTGQLRKIAAEVKMAVVEERLNSLNLREAVMRDEWAFSLVAGWESAPDECLEAMKRRIRERTERAALILGNPWTGTVEAAGCRFDFRVEETSASDSITFRLIWAVPALDSDFPIAEQEPRVWPRNDMIFVISQGPKGLEVEVYSQQPLGEREIFSAEAKEVLARPELVALILAGLKKELPKGGASKKTIPDGSSWEPGSERDVEGYLQETTKREKKEKKKRRRGRGGMPGPSSGGTGTKQSYPSAQARKAAKGQTGAKGKQEFRQRERKKRG